ncbi:hypothetical protein CIRG_05384 [Coccidioides immitis RMSCC 2394]|uniref:HTH psq-type domain-containing protein n=1 Tax=Coccidioides immitis RMSCC 2394 TaxID=404692 RepID=A0A0J6YFH9_COCIT|nr:hypothetical protein CIRG_05384 [Coccidioides immitis RMSCC 2394]
MAEVFGVAASAFAVAELSAKELQSILDESQMLVEELQAKLDPGKRKTALSKFAIPRVKMAVQKPRYLRDSGETRSLDTGHFNQDSAHRLHHPRAILLFQRNTQYLNHPVKMSSQCEVAISIAIRDFENGTISSVKTVAAAYNTPRSTLCSRLDGRTNPLINDLQHK